MKYFYLILLIYNTAAAQVPGGNVFQSQNIYTGYTINGNDVVLPVFKGNSDISGSPYFSKDWDKGSITTTDNHTFSENLLFMYDKTDNSLYFKNTDTGKIMKADNQKISSFILVSDKQHTFVNGSLINKDYTGRFFEVLVLNEKKYSLFKLTETSFQRPRTSGAAQAMTQTVSAGSYQDNITYFLFSNDMLQAVELKKRIFPEYMNSDASKAEAYIKNNKGDFNENYVVSLLNTING